jgi:NAD(P)-dependent dehydrogenase (short-subunit alcohol dehydrogenase family)
VLDYICVHPPPHACDLSEPDNCAGAVAAAVARFGRLDALCNIAGIIFLANSHEMPADEWHKTLAVNLSAPFFLSRAAIPHLLAANGAIVNVASSAAFIGEAYAAAYCATKSGLVNLTKAMAMEYMKQPIRINAVAPGGMITNIAVNFRPPEGCDIELLKRYAGLRGVVVVDDVAEMVAYLACDAARGYHGACLSIDAGITAG